MKEQQPPEPIIAKETKMSEVPFRETNISQMGETPGNAEHLSSGQHVPQEPANSVLKGCIRRHCSLVMLMLTYFVIVFHIAMPGGVLF